MSWKLDDIEFTDFGVYVSKVTGLFDLPAIQNEAHDWLDEDGEDYFHDIEDQRLDNKTISISCIILNDTYQGFISQLKAFYDALTASGKRVLTTPYTSEGIECYLEKSISIDRKSRYIGTKQIGIFTLTLTVPGDPGYNLIEIKRWANPDVIIPAVVKVSNAKVSKTLLGDMELTMSFESNTVLDIQDGDWIDYEYHGTGGNTDRFVLFGAPSFTKKSTNKYQYDLTFTFYALNVLERTQFLNDLGESDFSYYANMSELFDLLNANVARFYGAGFTKGTIDDTLRENHKFSGENCLEVLQRMCEEYELEYEFVKNNPDWWTYTCNIKEQVANDISLTLQYGKGKGQYNLKRGDRIEDEYFTKLYAFGSSDNLPTGYRNGLQRLSFDNNPLEQNADDKTYKEAVLFFDDIYPRRTGTITAYSQILEDDLTTAQKEVWPNGIFVITDSSIEFDINDYLLGGLTAKVIMKTGDLAGYEFDIAKYDHDTHEIYIIPYKDDAGYILPDDTLMPGVGDEYTLVNIDMPDSYVEAAEAELEEAAIEALAEGSTPQYEYTADIDPKFVADNGLFFEVGDRVTVVDGDYGINGTFRISKLTYSDFSRKYELTFSEKRTLSRIQTLEKTVETHERAIADTKSDTVESMRDSQRNVEELTRKLLDPADDKLNADSIVRDKSIDPGMLALDVDPNFYFEDALVELNYDGNEDVVHVSAGVVKITNYNTLTRYYIQKMKDNGDTYDPTRSWIVPETTINLPTKNAYALYLKLDLTEDSTDCVIEAFDTHLEGKALIQDNYLYKRFFLISKGEEEVTD
ncbi:hypothetical protein [Mangrovibacterium sp.]|uniref:hypothetical protein n=1 Tax=Mangrovibacterium sp. TaxID=1961364 RepID=UPI0035643376